MFKISENKLRKIVETGLFKYKNKTCIWLFPICLLFIFYLYLMFFKFDTPKILNTSVALSTNLEITEKSSKPKAIKLWNSFWEDGTYEFGEGSEGFREHGCAVQDCILVAPEDDAMPVELYDAILFHGPTFNPLDSTELPSTRSQFQRYVFFSMESPIMHPVSPVLDRFFNWTMTFRTDSDILVPYFSFYNKGTEEMIAPSENPKWNYIKMELDDIKMIKGILKYKKRPIAWFVSNCHAENDRMEKALQLKKFIPVDIYGECGEFRCYKNETENCFELLKKKYYLYLSFENSSCEDYITEKITNALLHDVVPIYYGGADLPKFLPPKSYIDARDTPAKILARRLSYLIKDPKAYLQFFWWKKYYDLYTRDASHYKPFCKLCEMLHDSSLPPKTYEIMTSFWNHFE